MSSLLRFATIQIRKDTAGNWTSENPTPHLGEWCIETDTGYTKQGDGSTAWTTLRYNIGPSWDDIRFALQLQRQGATGKPDFDYTNMGLLFPQNDATEIVYILGQMPHDWQIGTSIGSHIHWVQTGASFPVWTLEYRIYDSGGNPTGGFTTITTNTGVFSYVSGSLAQVSNFAAIDMSGITGISALLEFKLYRNDNVVTGDVLGKEFDIHYQKDSIGSISELVK